MAKEEIYLSIYRGIIENPRVQAVSQRGNCRKWSREAILELIKIGNENDIHITTEARETEVEPFLFHTFVRFYINEDDPYLFDGTGVSKFNPYFGPESKAPNHLQNSTHDMINYYLDDGTKSPTDREELQDSE